MSTEFSICVCLPGTFIHLRVEYKSKNKLFKKILSIIETKKIFDVDPFTYKRHAHLIYLLNSICHDLMW